MTTPRPAQHRGGRIGLLAFPLLIVAIGVVVERGDLFPELRREVQARSIPTGMLKLGQTGKLARLFEHKARGGVELDGIDGDLAPDRMPSSLVVPATEAGRGRPLLSLAIDADDLYDPDMGIIARPYKRGMKWERPGYVSYFDAGSLRFAAAAGVRIHGGNSRGHPQKSFRLYFRNLYGVEQFGPGLLFDSRADPIRTLVVHNDRRVDRRDPEQPTWRFMNPLAFDISRRIGGLAPRTRPVELFLNGISQGPYVLIERLDEDGLRGLVGADPLSYARTRQDAGTEPFRGGDRRAYDEFMRWPLEAAVPLTLDEARKRFDVENLVRWFISVLYCGTTDPFQGPVVLSGAGTEARWRWVNWDMDQSFMDYYARADEPWQIDIFDEVLVRGLPRQKRRAVLLDRLRRESPQFSDYFVRLLTEALNHELTPEFVQDRVDHYARLAAGFGVEDLRFVARLSRYADGRHAALLDQLPRYFDSGPARRVEVTSARALRIDGRRVVPPYAGRYVSRIPPRLEPLDEDRDAFSHWLVDGRAVSEDTLEPRAARSIEAIFDGDSRRASAADAR